MHHARRRPIGAAPHTGSLTSRDCIASYRQRATTCRGRRTRGTHRGTHHASIPDIQDTPDPSKQRKSPHLRALEWAILGSNQWFRSL
jgi:hypothetical protein